MRTRALDTNLGDAEASARPDKSTVTPNPTRKPSSGLSATARARSGALVYVARVTMDDPSLMVDGVRTSIDPGMVVKVEIKIGRRTVINYLLSPIHRAHDAVPEK